MEPALYLKVQGFTLPTIRRNLIPSRKNLNQKAAITQTERVMAVPMLKKETFRCIYYWLPVVIYAIFIFRVSSVPGRNIPSLFKGQDVIFHFFEYAGFSFLISRAVKEYFPSRSKIIRIVITLALVFTYALSDEFHQSLVPNRTASMFDIKIDTLGSLVGSLLYK